MDNLNTEIPYMITRFIWTTLIQVYTIHDNEVYMDNLNTEIPYMITRFIWTTLIQKYHTW